MTISTISVGPKLKFSKKQTKIVNLGRLAGVGVGWFFISSIEPTQSPCTAVCVRVSMQTTLHASGSSQLKVEVRDSCTGYLVPGRNGSGLLPDWESCWDVAAAVVTQKFRLTFIWSFQIGVWLIWELWQFWYRGSTQNFEPDWSSIVIWHGEPFLKTCLFSKCFPEITCSCVGEHLKIRIFDKDN